MKTLSRPIEPRVGCVAKAAEVLSGKWTALIIKSLAECPSRYCALEKSVTGINPRILSQRLGQLETSDIIIKSDAGYGLTKKGHDLVPVLEAMASWGAKYNK